MKKLALITTLLTAFAVVALAQEPTPIKFGGTLPATCTVNAKRTVLFYKTGSSNGLYQCLSANTWTRTGSGDTAGAASSTDNAIARFDGTGGKTLQNSGATVNDSGDVVASRLLEAAPGAGADTRIRFTGTTAGLGSWFGGGSLSLNTADTARFLVGASDYSLLTSSDGHYKFNSASALTTGAADVGFKRSAVGMIAFTDGSAGTGGSITAKSSTFEAGTATVAPINLTSGTNLTTPSAGSFEYDGQDFYQNPAANQRTLDTIEQFVSNTSDTTLNSDANAQTIFAAANDVLTVRASTTYFFEAQYLLTTGTTTHTTATLFGGTATLTSIGYWAELWSVTDGTISTTAPSVLRVAVGTSTVLNATSTAAATTIRLRGVIRVNAAGTLIPQIQFSANPTGTNLGKTNSYIRLWPARSNTAASAGPWN